MNKKVLRKTKGKITESAFRKLSSKVGKTIRQHKLINPDDHVLIALSGGKDSYVLLETLADRIPAMPFPVKLSAVHIKVRHSLYLVDTGYMEELCTRSAIDFYVREIEPDFEKDINKSPCFVCSWHRRKEIFKLGKELQCNKLAFGHHRDDALETLLMNIIFHGSISSLPYSIEMFEGRAKIIRPLLDLWEKEIGDYSRMRKYPDPLKSCQFEDLTNRNHIRRLLEELDRINPSGKLNMFRAMDNVFPDYLPKSPKKT